MKKYAKDKILPDIMLQDYAYIDEWTGRELLRPLDDYLGDGTLKLPDVPHGFIDGGKVNHHQQQHPKEAAKFIEFFTNDIEANKILDGERGVPIDTKVLATLKAGSDGIVGQSFDLITRGTAYATKLPPNDPPSWTQHASAYLAGMPLHDGGPLGPDGGVIDAPPDGAPADGADAGAADASDAGAAPDAGAADASDAGATDAPVDT